MTRATAIVVAISLVCSAVPGYALAPQSLFSRSGGDTQPIAGKAISILKVRLKAAGDAVCALAISAMLRRPAVSVSDPLIKEYFFEDLDLSNLIKWVMRTTGGHKTVEALRSALKDRNAHFRFFAVDLLDEINGPVVVEALIEALEDTQGVIQRAAAHVLGKIGDTRAVPSLSRLSEDPDPVLRIEAATALGAIGDEKAVPALNRLLSDPYLKVSSTAEHALTAIAMKGYLGKAHRFPLHIRKLIQARLLAKKDKLGLSEEDIDRLVNREGMAQWIAQEMQTGPRIHRWVKRLLRLQAPALVDEVTDVLIQETNKDLDAKAVHAVLTFHEKLHALLGRNPQVIEGLRNILQERMGMEGFLKFRKEFENNYGKSRTEAGCVEELVVNYYQERLAFGNPIRLLPAYAVEYTDAQRIKSERQPMKEWVEDAIRRETRMLHAEIQELSRDTRPIWLFELKPRRFFSTDWQISKDPKTLGNVQGTTPKERKISAEMLGRMGGGKAVPPLVMALLHDPNEFVRAEAADALMRLGDPRSVEGLAAALTDPVREVRLKAARALAETYDPRAEEVWIEALKNEDREMQIIAVGGLGKVGDIRAVEPLAKMLNVTDEEINPAVKRALIRIGAPAIPTLSRMATESDPSGYFLFRVCKILVGIDDRRGLPALRAALNHVDPVVRVAVIRAVGNMRDRADVIMLVTFLSDPSVEIRRCAAAALGDIGDARAVRPLIEALKSPSIDVRRASAKALGAIGDESAVGPLDILMRTDSYGEVCDAAAKAITAITMKQQVGVRPMTIRPVEAEALDGSL